MTDVTTDKDALIEKANKLARVGRTITEISNKLEKSWHEARSYLVSSSWRGAKVKITNRLEKLAKEQDPKKGKSWRVRRTSMSTFYTMQRSILGVRLTVLGEHLTGRA